MSIVQLELGQTISNEPIPKFTASKGQSYVLSIIDPKLIFACKSYYVDALKTADNPPKNIIGSVHATDELLPILGIPALHYFTLAVLYPLDGTLVKDGYATKRPDLIQFVHLKLGPANYDKLKLLSNSTPDITELDFSVDLEKGKETYQSMIYYPITTNSSKWKHIPEVVAKIDMYKDLFKSLLPDLVGEKVPAALILDYLHGKSAETIMTEFRKNNRRSFEFLTTTGSGQPAMLAAAQNQGVAQIASTGIKEEVNLDDLVKVGS